MKYWEKMKYRVSRYLANDYIEIKKMAIHSEPEMKGIGIHPDDFNELSTSVIEGPNYGLGKVNRDGDGLITSIDVNNHRFLSNGQAEKIGGAKFDVEKALLYLKIEN